MFDSPPANFLKMTTKPSQYISLVLHKAFIKINENGTEAAAATATVLFAGFIVPTKESPVVRADRPFLLAIQHIPSGACLFLGRVTDIK